MSNIVKMMTTKSSLEGTKGIIKENSLVSVLEDGDIVTVKSFNGKNVATIDKKMAKSVLKKNEFTVEEGEILVAHLQSDYHQYTALNYDLNAAVSTILRLYNKNCCDRKYTMKEVTEEYPLYIYKVKIDGFAFDDEYFGLLEAYKDVANYSCRYHKDYYDDKKDFFGKVRRGKIFL